MLLAMVLVLGGCYHPRTARQQHAALVEYNFMVDADSLMLIRQQPEEYVNHLRTDSFAVAKGRLLVVSDIRVIPQDKTDSVWVQLATEDNSFGWIHESRLLSRVVPDDPISQFILIFSNVHLLIFLVIIVLISVAYLVRKICHDNGYLVHFNDIDSPYPMSLALMVASSATFYATIQLFMPDMWRHFYYHPTLNPFAVPTVLGLFLASVWTILILAIACLDEVTRRLSFADSLLYLGGLLGVCALDYIVFSISTLYYVGYLLLAVYVWFAIRQYLRRR